MNQAMRSFGTLNPALHERLPLSIVKILYSVSAVFENDEDDQNVLVEFEANGECNQGKVLVKTSTALNDVWNDKEMVVYLALSGAGCRVIGRNYSESHGLTQCLRVVVIPDSVEELCAKCFYDCDGLSHVTFGESSCLKRVGVEAFYKCGLREIHIPDSVEELCDRCFAWCESLSRVAFHQSSSLKRIGFDAFYRSGLEEIRIPDSVEELCNMCFYGCDRLSMVTFGESSSLKRIGVDVFTGTSLRKIHIPDNVEELCDNCFYWCGSLLRITFGELSMLRRIGLAALTGSGVIEIRVPDCVEELCDRCFYEYMGISRVTFGESSSLKRIGECCFCCSGLSYFWLPPGVVSVGGSSFSECPLKNFVLCDVDYHVLVIDRLLLSNDGRVCYSSIGLLEEVVIPDCVEEICDKCFSWCKSLSRVTFGESSSLRRIGTEAFSYSGLREIDIPDSVEEICDKCFYWCRSLSSVTFGQLSSLKVIGVEAFSDSSLTEIRVPDGFMPWGRGCYHRDST